jgi:hypothetical protein
MKFNKYARVDVIKVATVNRTIFWDAKPCYPIEVRRRFGRNILLPVSPIEGQAEQ